MGLNHAIADNQQTELGFQSKPLRKHGSALENEVENHLRNLDKVVESISATRDQASFRDKSHNLVNNLRAKLKASHDMVRLAKLLSEPVRTSMFSKVRESLNDLEEDISSRWGVEAT